MQDDLLLLNVISSPNSVIPFYPAIRCYGKVLSASLVRRGIINQYSEIHHVNNSEKNQVTSLFNPGLRMPSIRSGVRSADPSLNFVLLFCYR